MLVTHAWNNVFFPLLEHDLVKAYPKKVMSGVFNGVPGVGGGRRDGRFLWFSQPRSEAMFLSRKSCGTFVLQRGTQDKDNSFVVVGSCFGSHSHTSHSDVSELVRRHQHAT